MKTASETHDEIYQAQLAEARERYRGFTRGQLKDLQHSLRQYYCHTGPTHRITASLEIVARMLGEIE